MGSNIIAVGSSGTLSRDGSDSRASQTVQTLAGAKKGRSAFGDITNTRREGHVDYLPAHKV